MYVYMYAHVCITLIMHVDVIPCLRACMPAYTHMLVCTCVLGVHTHLCSSNSWHNMFLAPNFNQSKAIRQAHQSYTQNNAHREHEMKHGCLHTMTTLPSFSSVLTSLLPHVSTCIYIQHKSWRQNATAAPVLLSQYDTVTAVFSYALKGLLPRVSICVYMSIRSYSHKLYCRVSPS